VVTVLSNGQIEFRFFRRGISKVCIAGTFNGWQIGDLPMHTAGDGWWRARIVLPGGVHQFRYVADGQWFTDFAAHGVEHSKWGLNSLLVLGGARALAA